jgi:hypothetical protein
MSEIYDARFRYSAAWPALLCNVKQHDDWRINKLQRVDDEAEVASFVILSGTCLEGLAKTMKSLGEDS